MNNLSFPEKWNEPKGRKYSEIKWHPIVNGYPKEKGMYLVTVHSEGIANYVITADWNNTVWSCELFGDVVAWANYPLPYIKG